MFLWCFGEDKKLFASWKLIQCTFFYGKIQCTFIIRRTYHCARVFFQRRVFGKRMSFKMSSIEESTANWLMLIYFEKKILLTN